MKAAIIGAGAIGGFYGAALADAGMDVSFIARGKTLIAIREHGLRLVGNTELTLDVPVTDDAAEIGQVDVVLLCTKTFHVAEAARTYLPSLMGPHTLVVTTQNGVIAPHELSAIIGPEHVAPGVCRQWVKIVEPGLIMDLGGPRMFEVSTIDDSPNTLVNELREACRKGGLTSPDVENITTTLWVKMCSVVPPRSLWCSTRRLLRRPPWPLPRCLRSVYRRNCSGGPRSQRQDRRRLRREEPHIPCWAGSRVNNLLPARHPCWTPQRIRCSGRSCPPIG